MLIYTFADTRSVRRALATEYFFALNAIGEGDIALVMWTCRPSLICGRFQNIYEECDLEYAKEKNIDVVRRLSGGGTIYADEGNTMFAFIEKKRGAKIDFSRYACHVVNSLKDMGLDAYLDGRNDICFDSRKVSGNSQYILRDSVVHHGTMAFSLDLDEMVCASRTPGYKIESKGVKSVRERVVNLCDFVDFGIDEFRKRLLDGIIRSIGMDSRQYVFSKGEQAEIERIERDVFCVEDNALKNPAFTFEKDRKFTGGRVCAHVTVKAGKIADIRLTGDFFATDAYDDFISGLAGTEFDYDAVLSVIGRFEGVISGVTSEEIATLICR